MSGNYTKYGFISDENNTIITPGLAVDQNGDYNFDNKNINNVDTIDANSIYVNNVFEKTLNNGVNVDGVLIKDGLTDGVDVSAFKTDYDSKVNQDVRTSSSPTFNNITNTSFTGSNVEGINADWTYLQLGANFIADKRIVLYSPLVGAEYHEMDGIHLQGNDLTIQARTQNLGSIKFRSGINSVSSNTLLQIPNSGITNNNANTNLLTLDGSTLKYRTLASTQSFLQSTYYLTNTTSISNATVTTLPYDAAYFNNIGLSVSSGIFTVPFAGIYNVDARVTWDDPGNVTDRYIWIEKNSVANPRFGLQTQLAYPAFVHAMSTSYQFVLTTNDTIRVSIFQSNGAALNIRGYNSGQDNPCIINFVAIRQW